MSQVLNPVPFDILQEELLASRYLLQGVDLGESCTASRLRAAESAGGGGRFLRAAAGSQRPYHV